MVDSFSQKRIIFLPKNTTSRLLPIDAGIIQNFKVKYKKKLVKYVFARINENSSATRIIKDRNILMAIQWEQEAWKEVTGTIIKNCFEKCAVVKSNDYFNVSWGKWLWIWSACTRVKPWYISRSVRLFRYSQLMSIFKHRLIGCGHFRPMLNIYSTQTSCFTGI